MLIAELALNGQAEAVSGDGALELSASNLIGGKTMQYLFKITVLGLPEAVWRLISLEGKADVPHTMALCNLAFDYANYQDGGFYLPQTPEQRRALACLSQAELHSYCTGLELERAPGSSDLWCSARVQNLADLQAYPITTPGAGITSLDSVIAALCDTFEREQEPYFAQELGYEVKPSFLYVVHGVQHLVEVKRREEKLACFVPAALMGAVPVKAYGLEGEPEELSYELLNQELATLEQALNQRAEEVERKVLAGEKVDPNWEHEFSLNLKECTSRLRALGAMRTEKQINNAVLQAGGAAIKVQNL